ncbi:MAG: type II secretion system protein N [Proteobacteria bacterium]|nr:type II secretion system protein N [Pseudomonadota bacterium]
MRIRFPTSRPVIFGVMFMVALIMFLPLRMVVSGVTAREASGLAWAGSLKEARVGPAVLGDLDARLSPVRLLVGEARLAVSRADFTGAVVMAPNRRAAESVTGTLPLDGLPVGSFDFSDVSVRFRDGLCDRAEGIVRANTDRGSLSGAARCDRGALLLPLANGSGEDKLDLRVTGDGRYDAGIVAGGQPVTISGQF